MKKGILIFILSLGFLLSTGFMLYRDISDTIPRDSDGPSIMLTLVGIALLGIALVSRYIKVSVALRVPATWVISIMALLTLPFCINATEVDMGVYDYLTENDQNEIFYTVQPGDTVNKIAAMFGKTEKVDIKQLTESNFYRTNKNGKFVQFRDPAKLKAGERLFISYDWVFPPNSGTEKFLGNPEVTAAPIVANIIPIAEPEKTGLNLPLALILAGIVLILILAYIRRCQIRRAG